LRAAVAVMAMMILYVRYSVRMKLQLSLGNSKCAR
jgi:hypothetical protein